MEKERIYYATSNEGKVERLRYALDYFKVPVDIVQVEIEFEEPQSNSVERIARKKAIEAYEILERPCITMDAAFHLDGRNGWPGHSLDMALESFTENTILKILEGRKRSCNIEECLAYYNGKLFKLGNPPQTFYSIVDGKIAQEGKGKYKDWLHRLFIPNGEEKTFGEMNLEEKMNLRKKFRTYHIGFSDYLLREIGEEKENQKRPGGITNYIKNILGFNIDLFHPEQKSQNPQNPDIPTK